MRYPDYVRRVIRRLESAGYEAFIVGGSLRDFMLGITPHDFDIATSARPEQMLSVFSGMKVVPTGLKHGTLTVLADGNPIEVTTYRTDGEYTDSRHPSEVSFTCDITSDLARRDFTVNAMAYNENSGLVDPFGGADDLNSGVLRAVGDPRTRMREDALRIMRAFRFSAQLGFDIEPETLRALDTEKEGLGKISRERIAGEFSKLICSPSPASALMLTEKSGVMPYVLSGLTLTESTVSLVESAPPVLTDRLCILLCGCTEDSARGMLHSLKYPNAVISDTLTLCEGVKCPLPLTEADARRFLIRYGELAGSVLSLSSLLGREVSVASELTEKVSAEGFCRNISELAVDGNDLRRLGFDGRQTGDALRRLFASVTEVPERNRREWLLREAERIKDRRAEE